MTSRWAGIGSLTWESDTFAYAESYDKAAGRYRGLRVAEQVTVTEHDTALLVRPEVARHQLDAEMPPAPVKPAVGAESKDGSGGTPAPGGEEIVTPAPAGAGRALPQPRRFHGSVTLDPARVGRDASRIADEVITHMVGLVGASVRVTLEIEVDIPAGAPDHVVRTVTENSRTLKFDQAGFERE